MAFETSDAYKEAINKLSRVSTVTGKLTTKAGTEIPIDNSTIDSGSFYITNQCVSSDAFAYGSVFAAELGIRLKTNIDRYSLYDATLELSYNLLIGPGTYEPIPLGKYYISDPTRSGETISIKAYDGMIILEDEVTESSTGTVFELLELVSHNTGIELAQTEEEINALVNGTVELSLDMAKVKTYRDLVANLAIVTCTFAVFDRYGKLKLCSYGTEISKNINIQQKTASKFSDFTTYYSGVKCKFLESGTYVNYSKIEEGDGLIYDLGEIPIVQGLPETNQPVLDAIFEVLKTVRYVPCEITFTGDPAMDLGDMMHNVDYKGNEFDSLVTYYKWTYRGSEQIKSAGANPKLAKAKEKAGEVDLGSIEGEIDKKSVAVYTFTNARELQLKYAEEVKNYKEIIRVAYAAVENTTALFIATVPVDMDKDGYVELSMFIDGIYYDDSRITQYCHKGKSVITFVNYIGSEANHTYKVTVMARTLYVDSVEREQTAKIATNENARQAIIVAFEELTNKLSEAQEVPLTELPVIEFETVEKDTSVPIGIVEKYAIKAVVIGQGLAGKVKWDGTIQNDEMFARVPLKRLNVDVFNDAFALSKPTRDDAGPFTEQLTNVLLRGLRVEGFNDATSLNPVTKSYTFETAKADKYDFNKKYVSIEEGFKLNTVYTFESVEQQIDSGKMCSVAIDYTGLTVESVVVSNG